MGRIKPLIWLLAFIKFVLPFLLQDQYYQLHRDEFLYLDYGNHMAFGYMEVPPLLSVFSWITHLFPQSVFIVKLWPSLFGAFTFILVAKAIIYFGGKQFAIFLAFLAFILTAYLRVHFLFQPGFLEIFFWTAVAYTLLRFIQTEHSKWLYLAALSLAFGFLSKYSITIFAVSIFGGLLLTPQRKIFFNRHFYYAMLLALVIISPNIWWQYAHNFPIVTHMNELKETQLQYISSAGFLFDQVLMNLPCFFVWMAGLYYVLFGNDAKPYRAFGFAYALLIILLIVLHGKNYYALGIYPILFSFGAFYLEKVFVGKRYVLRYVAIAFSFIIGLPLIPVLLPVTTPAKLAEYYNKMSILKTGVLKWEDLKDHELPQDFGDMLGWRELSQKAEKQFLLLPAAEQDQTVVYCRSYGQAGALKYYGNSKKFSSKVISDNGTYRLWIPENMTFKNLLFVGHNLPGKDDEVFQHFASAQLKDSVDTKYSRQLGDKVILFKDADSSAAKLANAGLHEERSKFSR